MRHRARVNTPATSVAQDAARIALGLMLTGSGISHLTFARRAFRAQVPPWLPLSPDLVVKQSGLAEIALGIGLLGVSRQRRLLGRTAAVFFTVIFPGNVAQYTQHRNAFGLDTDQKRFTRLFLQPVLIAWSLWSTGNLRRRTL